MCTIRAYAKVAYGISIQLKFPDANTMGFCEEMYHNCCKLTFANFGRI